MKRQGAHSRRHQRSFYFVRELNEGSRTLGSRACGSDRHSSWRIDPSSWATPPRPQILPSITATTCHSSEGSTAVCACVCVCVWSVCMFARRVSHLACQHRNHSTHTHTHPQHASVVCLTPFIDLVSLYGIKSVKYQQPVDRWKSTSGFSENWSDGGPRTAGAFNSDTSLGEFGICRICIYADNDFKGYGRIIFLRPPL